MSKNFTFGGEPINERMKRIQEKDVPYYIRNNFGKDGGYLQRKRKSTKCIYFYKEVSEKTLVTYYMVELEIEEVAELEEAK